MGINIRRKFGNTDSTEALLSKFKEQSESIDCPCTITVAIDLVSLKILEDRAKWWSPELNLRIEMQGGESMIYEVVGPNAATFTLAMFFIFLGAVAFIAAFILMIAQIQLGMLSSLAWVGSGLSVILIALALGGLAYGRTKARDQVAGLRRVVEQVIGA